jgi:hypothetical protein
VETILHSRLYTSNTVYFLNMVYEVPSSKLVL